MECYRTKEGDVVKYVHDDGSETAIKAVESTNSELGHDPISCSKWAIFLSSSVGCQVKCSFCYLTIKNYPHENLTATQIFDNAVEAIEAEIKARPELKEKFFKISWMGMGDPAFIMDFLPLLSLQIINYVMINGYAKGCEGVDLSTTIPIWKSSWIQDFVWLNKIIEERYPRNELNTEQLSRVRFFYSLNSTFFGIRKEMIPLGNIKPETALGEILPSIKQAGIDTICHHVLLKEINDRDRDLEDLEDCFKENDIELRLLRYNKCPSSNHDPSQRFDEFFDHLKTRIGRIRYQVSPGSEVAASCGMFLMKDKGK